MPDTRAIQRTLMETTIRETDYYRTIFDAFNCLICYKTFVTKGDLYDHQRKEHFESKRANRFACIRCVKKTTNFAQLPNDTNDAINSSTISSVKENVFCTICDKSIKAAAWSRHSRNHRDRVVYQCESCRKIQIGYFRFKNHIAQSPSCNDAMFGMNNDKVDRESSKSYVFQCEKCSETFTRRSFRVRIKDSNCYAENQCKLCSKRFITKSALNEHRLVSCVKVEIELTYDCATCEKSFLTKQGLVRHSKFCRKSSTEQKTIRCDICKILVESDGNHWKESHLRKSVVKLKRIANVVPKRKNLTSGIQFGCLLCDGTLNDRNRLRVHMKVHYCDKSVQTVADDEIELTWDLMGTDSKALDTFNLKDEKMDSAPMFADDANKIQYSNEVVKAEETTFNFENMWTMDSDQFDNLANDDPVEDDTTTTSTSNDVMQSNGLGTTICCLCQNVVPDLINTDDVVEQQISRYGETTCLICFQLFNGSDKLREHERSHFQDNLDGHAIACRSCAWSSIAYYTDDDFFRLENELQGYMCSIKMGDLRTLRRHKRAHLSLCVFTCKVCNKKSISDERHRNHLRKHMKPEMAVVTDQIVRNCTMCGDEATNLFRDEKDIDRMFEKFGGGPCKICFTYINDKKRYITHERGHMDEQQLVSCFKCCNTKPYTDTCFICMAKLSSKYNLHLHKRKHLDRVVYSCTICSSLVVGTRNHSHHMYKHGHHKKNREEETGHFECDYSRKVFPHKSSLPAHFKQHLNKQRVPCPQCTLTFASKGNLTQHIKQIHLNIRKHICELCGKSHMVKHSGEKPYQCPICFKRFGYYSRMKSHAWIHSGLKPYKCDQCDKCYNDSTDLRRHKRIHGGVEKKFECELCKIKFYEHKYLRANRASSHKFLAQ